MSKKPFFLLFCFSFFLLLPSSANIQKFSTLSSAKILLLLLLYILFLRGGCTLFGAISELNKKKKKNLLNSFDCLDISLLKKRASWRGEDCSHSVLVVWLLAGVCFFVFFVPKASPSSNKLFLSSPLSCEQIDG